MQDTMLMEWQFGAPHPKHYWMPKELWICLCHYMDLHWIVLWGTSTSTRCVHLLPGIQDTGILWVDLFQLGPNLRMGWIPGLQLLRQQIQMLCPISMLPIRLTCIPHALPMLVFSSNPLAAWRVCSSKTRRTLSMCYTGISFSMCQHPRGEQSGHWIYLETKWGWACIYQCIVVCPMSLQSSRGEWAQMRLLCGITMIHDIDSMW